MQNNIVYKYKLPRSLWPTFCTSVDIFVKIENVATVQVSDLLALGPLVHFDPGERSLAHLASSYYFVHLV